MSQTQTVERNEKARTLPKEVIELVEQPNFGHVATINKDGTLHVTPVWVDHEGDKYIVFNSAYGRRKVKNLERDPRVAISISDQKNPYHNASITGKVVDITPENADPHIDKMAKKYIGKDKYPWRGPNEKRALIKIAPLWIHYQ